MVRGNRVLHDCHSGADRLPLCRSDAQQWVRVSFAIYVRAGDELGSNREKLRNFSGTNMHSDAHMYPEGIHEKRNIFWSFFGDTSRQIIQQLQLQAFNNKYLECTYPSVPTGKTTRRTRWTLGSSWTPCLAPGSSSRESPTRAEEEEERAREAVAGLNCRN